MKKLLIYLLIFNIMPVLSFSQEEKIQTPAFAKKPLPARGNPPKQTSSNKKKAKDIVSKMDKKQTYPSAKIKAQMIIRDNHHVKKQKMTLYSRGDIDTLIKMTDGEAKNQKILRTETDIYVYFPDLDQQLRLSGASLRQGIVGSDVSYEDITTIKKTLEDFDVYYLGEDIANGYPSWVILLIEKKNRVDKDGKRKAGVAYPVQRLWIDKKSYLAVRNESYSKSQKLLKLSNTLSYKIINNYTVPTHLVLQDKLKKNTSTTMKFLDINLNAQISDRTFSLENLTF